MAGPRIGRSGGVRVVIFDAPIDAMHQPGGMVYDEFRDAAREVAFLAKLDEAPHARTGAIVRGIRIASERRASRRKVGFYVRSDAAHSYWVHEGTRTPITSIRPGGLMSVPAFKGSTMRVRRKEVRGQPGRPFLTNNLRYVMAGVAT